MKEDTKDETRKEPAGISLSVGTLKIVDELVVKEFRNRSNMVEVLILEAIANRNANKKTND